MRPAARSDLGSPVMPTRSLLYGLFFVSGTAGLVYEVLWMRYFQLLFGNTAKAAATVLIVFFLGMAIGSLAGGRLAHRGNPLRTYGWVELGIALAASPVPFLLPLYERVVPAAAFFDAAFSLDLLRFGLALLVTLPAGILLGATFPIMGAALITTQRELGRTSALLYGLNTLGAVCGVALTGFFLPAAIGVTLTYASAIALNVVLAGLVLAWLGRRPLAVSPSMTPGVAGPSGGSQTPSKQTVPPRLSDRGVLVLAFGSGLALIGLEVLWTRMFALVFQNSVYSFAAIVVTVLVGLSLGALLVSRLAPRMVRPVDLLGATLSLAAISTALSPLTFFKTTGVTYFAYGAGWPAYLYQVIGLVTVVILLPALLAGMTLPLLWRLFHREERSVGMSLGTVNFWNLLGAIAGAAGAGFFLIPSVGLWTSIAIMAGILLALGQVAWWSGSARFAWRWSVVVAPVFLVALLVANPLRYPVQQLADGERLLYLNEGEDAVVSVVEDGAGARWLKSNNTYRLGATVEVRSQKRLGHLPLLLHPEPKSVAFVGVGTGISMSAGLDHSLDRMVGVELLPGVIDAAPYFSSENRSLLTNGAVQTVVGDGRVYLRTTSDRFDVVIADLFIPWHAGTGNLYTAEHFAAARGRLNPGGVFCQWLPLYQMSERELGTIAATFASVFPHASMWRADFSTTAPILGFVGSMEPLVLDEAALGVRLARLADHMSPSDKMLASVSDLTLLYAGELGSLRAWIEHFPVNTDDRPIVEFEAPISQSRQQMVTDSVLSSFYWRVQNSPAPDPVRVRTAHASGMAALSPLPGNLLFVATEAGVKQDLKTQAAAIKRAAELHPGSNVLALFAMVADSMSATPTRGVAMDSAP
jgi:spermidine synthase